MIDKEKVVVVIATHNNAGTISRAVESVTKGIRPADQIVVGDNDSRDGTYEVLCKLLGAEEITIDGKQGLPPQFDGKINDVPIRIFRKQLTTIANTINVAIQMKWQEATILGFMEPTSWYAPDKIAQAIRVFNGGHPIACVVSDCDNHYLDGRIERVFRSSFDMQRLMAGFPYDRNFLLRPQIFAKLGNGFNEQMCIMDDYDLLLRISEIGLIYHIPAPLHNNTVVELDDDTRQLISRMETAAKQLTAQRRDRSNG